MAGSNAGEGAGGVDEADAGRWILAVDLGTGGPKVAVIGLDGAIRATAARAVHTTLTREGEASQDADEWWGMLLDAAREAIAAAYGAGHDLHAVAVTGQYGSTVPVGAQGEVVGRALLWADSRAGDLVRPLVGGPVAVGGYAPHKALPFIRVTGGVPSPNGADPTGHALLLKERLADVYARAAVLLEPVDFLGLRFTGRVAATPASMLASWLTDNRIGAPLGYSAAMVARARRDPDRLPPLVPTGTVLGPLLGEVADALGVAVGVPVVAGIPDLHAAVVGSGAVAPYATHLSISTTAWIGARVPFKKTDALHSIATVPGLDAEHPIVANNHETGGAALQWLREQIIAPHDGLLGGGSGLGDHGLARDDVAPSFDDLTALAATAPAGSDGVLFTPWLDGERSPVDDKRLRAAWLNVSLRTDRAVLVRSVLEGVAYNARWLFEPYVAFLGRSVPSVRILGGGAQSDLWCQIHADVLGVPVEQVADPRDAQLRGVALWARVCLGELTVAQAGEMVRVARRFEPARDRAAYESGYAEYRRLYGTLKGLYHRLNAGRG